MPAEVDHSAAEPQTALLADVSTIGGF